MKLMTERLLMREFTGNDWPAVLAYQSDARYLRYYPWVERTPEEVKAFVQIFLAQQAAQPRLKFQLAITLKTTGQLVGNCGLRLTNANDGKASLGYELAPAYWGNGYATEAAQAMVKFGFTDMGLHRIYASCLAENSGSIRVLTKLGMQPEGRLRQNDYFKGKYWDTLLFGILKEEWENSR